MQHVQTKCQTVSKRLKQNQTSIKNMSNMQMLKTFQIHFQTCLNMFQIATFRKVKKMSSCFKDDDLFGKSSKAFNQKPLNKQTRNILRAAKSLNVSTNVIMGSSTIFQFVSNISQTCSNRIQLSQQVSKYRRCQQKQISARF